MWCIGNITEEYRQRMYELLELYAKPYDRREPVICLDKKSKQLLKHTRQPLAGGVGIVRKEDYEYKRGGTCNLFVAVEPRAGRREVQVTRRRTKQDFVDFIRHLLGTIYAGARRIHLVADNLNIHFRKAFVDVLGTRQAALLLRRVEFHYTPKHASWLNMAEIEIGILERQCTRQRIPTLEVMTRQVAAWQQQRNAEKRSIEWRFTRRDADRKLGRHYCCAINESNSLLSG